VTLVFILCAWPVASIILALILGPVCHVNDRESADDAGRRLPNADDSVAPVRSFHSGGVPHAH
jgi:hypothetical protein